MVEAVFARLDARSANWSARMISGFDHYLVYAFGILAVLGLVISFAAGPVVAGRIGIADPFYFTERHVLFLALTIIGTVTTAMLPVSTARRLGILVALSALILIVCVLLFGMEIKGAKRWLHVAGFGLQPSEFFKPGFIMAAAWFLSAKPEDGFPGSLVSLGLY
ncbi:MAG: FtsW/RodA/SpoVE family cell cycle protein, partial [Pseudomonadota bacterium]